jgi:hypothetical protein
MRIPRVRFTIRGMMIAVAVVAVAVWCERTCRQWGVYQSRFEFYSAAEHFYRPRPLPPRDSRYTQCCGGGGLLPSGEGMCQLRLTHSVAEDMRFADYLAVLKSKYGKAMSCPWLPVEPDPPEPE